MLKIAHHEPLLSNADPHAFNMKFDPVEKDVSSILKDERNSNSLWIAVDFNGNGGSTLAEIDHFLRGRYPGVLNSLPAIMRAYKRSVSDEGGGSEQDYIEKKEFPTLLRNLVRVLASFAC